MTDVGKRVYRSDLREGQARATRRQIVDAASKLFAERGYAAATIDAVAQEAGVSRKTVFTSVGGKVEVMRLAYDWAITGDDEPVSMGSRPEVLALEQEPDSARVLERWAAMLSHQMARVAPMHAALRSAADVDPQAHELFEKVQDQRLAGMRKPVSPTRGARSTCARDSRRSGQPTSSGSTWNLSSGSSSSSVAAGRERRTPTGSPPP